MKLTVADVLTMEAFSKFRPAAGMNGYHREIKSVGMLDYELGDMVDQNFGPGELVVTTLVGIKDDLEALEDIVKRLIRVKSAGFAIKTIYMDELPESVRKICDEAQYPLFFFEETFFEVLITGVNDALKEQVELSDLENQIDRLLTGDMNKYGIRRAAQSLNRGFADYVAVAYLKVAGGEKRLSAMALSSVNSLSRNHKCFFYRGGYVLVVSSEQEGLNHLEVNLKMAMGQLGLESSAVKALGDANWHVGLSDFGLKLEKLDVAIHEALFAYETSERYGVEALKFSQMGLERMLLPVKDNPWVMAYYESVIEPIMTYDRKNGTELVRTAVVYILSGGDIKLAAERLYQHGNTVRYRMDRVRQIVSEYKEDAASSAWSFYEVLAVAVRLHLIYTGDLSFMEL